MKYVPLIWAGLARKPARTVFTFLSVIVAFVLFGFLEGLNAGFATSVANLGLDALITEPRVPGGPPMPIASLPEIEKVPGVIGITQRASFIGYWREPKDSIAILATDPSRWFPMRPGMDISKEHLETFARTPASIIVTPAMMKYFGWHIGERIPFKSEIARRDGSTDWAFDLVGTFDVRALPNTTYLAMMNYDYLDNERAAGRGYADRFMIRIAHPARSVATADAIDRIFRNSSHETRTRSEKEMAMSRLQQVGDITFLTNTVVGSAFLTLLFVTANTMRQSVRERTREFAILKTLGFPDAIVLLLVLGEALALCLLAAVAGLALAAAITPFLGDQFGPMRHSWWVTSMGLLVAVLVGIISASWPAWRARQLRIVEALAGEYR